MAVSDHCKNCLSVHKDPKRPGLPIRMTDRTRRAFLALGVGAFGSAAGCIGRDGGAPRTTPGGVTATTGNETTDRTTATQTTSHSGTAAAHLSFNHAKRLHRINAGFAQHDVASYYLGLLTSPDHAAAFPTDRFENQDAKAFVTDTDFSQAALVVVQDRRSSSHPDLELLGTRREGYTVTVKAQYPGRGGTADITTDTLLVRVPTTEGSVRAASATIQPQHGEPIQFSTTNVYDVVPAFDPAGDLVLRNRDCANAPLSVTITYQGDLFFRDGMNLQPASLRRVGGVFTHPGEWTVAVHIGGETITRSWSLTDGPPGDVLIDVAGDGTVSLSHQATGVDGTSRDTCETNGYPYESSSPTENLDHPVDLWVLDRSDGEHHLTVTIRDNDTEVFSGEFDMRAGYDKVQRAGLLAKKTTYSVEVTTDGGTTVTESVTVREGVKKLTVRVTESGKLTMSLE